MNTTDAAWLAGILDGEGTLLIVESRRKLVYNPSFEAQVAVTKTDRRIVARCKDLAGGTLIGPVGRGKPELWKPAYRWAVNCQKATSVLRLTFPYLVAKQEQAAILLQLTSQINAGACKGQFGRKAASPEQVEYRRMLKHAVQALNHRGGGAIPQEKAAALAEVRRQLKSGISSFSSLLAIAT